MRQHKRALLLGGIGGVSLLTVLVSCLDDPREGEEVKVTETCDLNQLSSEASNPQSSLRQYVESTSLLLEKATAMENALKDACNAIDGELALPQGGDVEGACRPLFQRIQSVLDKQPPSAPGALGNSSFVQIDFPSTCHVASGSIEGCIAKCAGACDPSKCEQGKSVGTCSGDCVGTCVETGDNLGCNGNCVGVTELDGGSCRGECTGRCTATAWVGECTGACPAAFVGTCKGTCTGKCDGVGINLPPDAGVDAGPEAGPPDAGDPDAGDAAVEAGPPADGGGGPPPNPFPKPPSNADGNCPGKCEGVCSSGATGACSGPCFTYADAGPPIGQFLSGFCGAGGVAAANCFGTCQVAGGGGTVGVCTGECSQPNKAQCPGVCRPGAGGQCNGTLNNAVCEGALNCGQNIECNNACQAFGILGSVCGEVRNSEIYTVTDPALDAALTKHQAALGAALNQLSNLRKAFIFIGNRTLGDFRTLGLTGEITRVCVESGRKNVDLANAKITAASNADPTARKTK